MNKTRNYIISFHRGKWSNLKNSKCEVDKSGSSLSKSDPDKAGLTWIKEICVDLRGGVVDAHHQCWSTNKDHTKSRSVKVQAVSRKPMFGWTRIDVWTPHQCKYILFPLKVILDQDATCYHLSSKPVWMLSKIYIRTEWGDLQISMFSQ